MVSLGMNSLTLGRCGFIFQTDRTEVKLSRMTSWAQGTQFFSGIGHWRCCPSLTKSISDVDSKASCSRVISMTTTTNIRLHVNLAVYTLIFNCDAFKFRISKDIKVHKWCVYNVVKAWRYKDIKVTHNVFTAPHFVRQISHKTLWSNGLVQATSSRNYNT